jgi:hypothetical protein
MQSRFRVANYSRKVSIIVGALSTEYEMPVHTIEHYYLLAHAVLMPALVAGRSFPPN